MLLVQLLHVVNVTLPGTSRPVESEPVSMSCMFGVLPTPLTSSPFSLSAVGLRMLLRSWCKSSTFDATSAPRALNHGPRPMRSRACVTPFAPCAPALMYARHVTLPRPAAAPSCWQCASAPARPPKLAPSFLPTLVTKKLIGCGGG